MAFKTYNLALLMSAFVIWNGMYQAGFEDYDENWGILISVFLLSVLMTFIILLLIFKKHELIKRTIGQTIFFLIFASPITVVLVIFNYQIIFGRMLKV